MNLGGIDLGSGLYREDRLGDSLIDGRMVLSRAKTPLVWEQAGGPRSFDLVSKEGVGTLIHLKIAGLQALSSVPGGTYPLIDNGETYQVRFRTWEKQIIEADPLGPREAMTDNDVYKNIRIKLMETGL